MPYSKISELPDTFNNLPTEAKQQAMAVINSLLKDGVEEESAIKQTWGAIKRSWKRVGDEWIKKESEEFSEVFNLEEVEIFKAGKWNGEKYDIDDIDRIISSHYSLSNEGKVPLKIGHSESQTLLKSDELPAAGWITRLWRKGDILLANVSDVPKKIYDLIKNKAYKRISSELCVNLKDSLNNTHKYVLRAVALLGSAIPAVGTLKDIEALYSKQNSLAICFNAEGGEIMEEKRKEKEEVKDMDDTEKKAFEEKVATAEFKAAEADAKAVDAQKKLNEAQLKLNTIETEKKFAENNNIVEKAISEGHLAPSQKDFVLDILNHLDGTKVFSEIEIKDRLKSFLESNKIILGETSKKGEEQKPKTLLEMAKEIEAEKKVVFKEALKIASKEHPELIEKPKEL